jgi:hypothetical protein
MKHIDTHRDSAVSVDVVVTAVSNMRSNRFGIPSRKINGGGGGGNNKGLKSHLFTPDLVYSAPTPPGRY